MRLLQFTALCLCAVVHLGCGGPTNGVRIKGKLLQNGQPAQVDISGKLPPGDTGRMRVTFYPVTSDDERIVDSDGNLLPTGGEIANVESDGSFTVAAKSGKYRVVITHFHPSTDQDLLKGAFNEARSKVTRDISANQEIVIDLVKDAVK
jgi:hypothetical protein